MWWIPLAVCLHFFFFQTKCFSLLTCHLYDKCMPLVWHMYVCCILYVWNLKDSLTWSGKIIDLLMVLAWNFVSAKLWTLCVLYIKSFMLQRVQQYLDKWWWLLLLQLLSTFWFFLSSISARHKLDEDLGGLRRQLLLQAGEDVPPLGEETRPASAYLNTPMVNSSTDAVWFGCVNRNVILCLHSDYWCTNHVF